MRLPWPKLSHLAEFTVPPGLPWPAGCIPLAVRKISSPIDVAALVPPDALPAMFRRSAPVRQYEFVLGRIVAATSLRNLGVCEKDCWIGTDHRRPVWPQGFVGSIAHTHTLLLVTVGLQSETLVSIGVDIECVSTSQELLSSLNICFSSSEHRLLSAVEHGLLIGFSAKESLFKCLSEEAGKYFDFLDAEVISINPKTNLLELQLLVTLSSRLPHLSIFKCFYNFSTEHVWTFTAWTTDYRVT